MINKVTRIPFILFVQQGPTLPVSNHGEGPCTTAAADTGKQCGPGACHGWAWGKEHKTKKQDHLHFLPLQPSFPPTKLSDIISSLVDIISIYVHHILIFYKLIPYSLDSIIMTMCLCLQISCPSIVS